MPTEIKQLKTAKEITQLASYNDDAKDELMLCDYGEMIQWLVNAVPQNPKTMAVFAVYVNDRIAGYIVLIISKILPLYHYGSVLRLHCSQPDLIKLLGEAAIEWGKKQGVKRVMVSTYDNRAKLLYERIFGFKHCGYQLDREI
jgi:hypothetical protein